MSLTAEIHNARIIQTTLGLEDHGMPTSYVTCQWGGGSTQGFGGFDLRHGRSMLHFVMGVQRVIGVDDWSKVKGALCRVRREGHDIVAIGNIITEDWFHRDEILAS